MSHRSLILVHGIYVMGVQIEPRDMHLDPFSMRHGPYGPCLNCLSTCVLVMVRWLYRAKAIG